MEEFEKLLGCDVSPEEFNEADRVYMAAGAMSKADFVAAYNDMNDLGWGLCKVLAEEVHAADAARQKLHDSVEQDTHKTAVLHDNIALTLLRAFSKYKDKDLFDAAVALVGMRDVVVLGLGAGYALPAEALEYVKDNLG